ncbi:hypothetical protein RND71_043485 [Anisodus tanguticus]|uniref:Pre-mRNA-processing factor 19 n=1 Tax=Anisodus tanguticus TaxID=243964 RepID=A0AAE1QNT5_9SOLA|nr:hypothetical protein RND71_043485 [Anisodus tanguticus]
MSVICSLSNEVPEIPVVSPLSGAVFEKRLIVKYIQENGADPINGQELREDQLIELKIPLTVKPKPPTFTSIPSILKTLQDEWDAVMLNSYEVRKQLQIAKQELSNSLYHHDAACRVISRLNNELDAAREALATLKPKYESNNKQNGHDNNETEISDQVFIEKLQAKANELTASRKKRTKKLPDNFTSADSIGNFKTVNSFTGLHSASIPGILALDISNLDDNLIVTGGNDKTAVVFNKETEQIVATFKGHTKKVSSVIYHPNEKSIITASSDTTIRVWNIASAESDIVLKLHDGPITSICLHPLNDYILSTSTDELWAFSDINSGKCLLKLGDTTNKHILTTAQFHPDGMILGCGTSDSLIKIWDLKDKTNVANFPGHSGSITSLKFSENGYHLATSSTDGEIKLWDLRKLENFKTITSENNYPVNKLSFDYSGFYLAIAGNDIQVYQTKKWDNLKVFADHTSAVTDVKFGKNAAYIASTGLDRSLKIYKLDD